MREKSLNIPTFVKIIKSNLNTVEGEKNYKTNIALYTLLMESLLQGLNKDEADKYLVLSDSSVSKINSYSNDIPSSYISLSQRKNKYRDVSQFFAHTICSKTFISEISLNIVIDKIDQLIMYDETLTFSVKNKFKKLLKNATQIDYLAEVWIFTISNNKNYVNSNSTSVPLLNPISARNTNLDSSLSFENLQSFIFEGIGETAFNLNISIDGLSADIEINYNPIRIRNFIPQFGGVYINFSEAKSIAKYEHIEFEIMSKSSNLKKLTFEVKPFCNAWTHEKFDVNITSDFKKIKINLSNFYDIRTLDSLGEFTWVINPINFVDDLNLSDTITIKNIALK